MTPAAFRTLASLSLATLLAACGGDTSLAARYTVGGSLAGLSGTGLVMQLNGSGTLPLTSNGNFDFTTQLEVGTVYSVTVQTQPAGQYCSVSSGTGTIAYANVANVSIRCAATDPALLAYEGFNYVIGQPLLDRSGGLGWSAAWRVVDGNSAADVSLGSAQSGTIAAGLNYTDSQGQRLVTTEGAWRTDAAAFFGQARRATTSNFGAVGTTRWISFLVRQAAPSATPVTPTLNYVTGTVGTGYTFLSPAMSGGTGLYVAGPVAGAGPFYGTGVSTVLSSNVWYEGAIGLVVLRITFNASTAANDTISLWLNPVLGTDPGAALLNTSTANYADAINGVTLTWGDYRAFVIDEVRVGTDYASVTPFL